MKLRNLISFFSFLPTINIFPIFGSGFQPIAPIFILSKLALNIKVNRTLIYCVLYFTLLFLFSVFGYFRSGNFDLLSLALYMLGPITFYYFFFDRNKPDIALVKLIFILNFFISLGIFLFPNLGISDFLELFQQRSANAYARGGGNGGIFLEPSIGGYFIPLMYLVILKNNNSQKELVGYTFLFIISVMLNASATIFFIILMIILFFIFAKYPFSSVILIFIFLNLLLALVENGAFDGTRVNLVFINISNLISDQTLFLETPQDVVSASEILGSRRLSQMIAGLYHLISFPLGGGLGTAQSSLFTENLNSINIFFDFGRFNSELLSNATIKPWGYFINLAVDFGLLALVFLMLILVNLFKLLKKGNALNITMFLVGFFLCTFWTTISNPAPWIFMALSRK